ncbi:MAG: DUF6106 family protein [Clostridium sp.]|nr:DUF6106 family protein [Clostridium sp.]MCM1207330.1 DUF6106 family protein [Ruminococcus sp.]
MDDYIEQVIRRKRTFMELLPFVLSFIIALVGVGVFATVGISYGALVIVIGGFLGSLTSKKLHSQFEYIFTNGDFDSAIIYNLVKRKEFFSFDADHVTRVLPYESDKLKNELDINKSLVVKNITTGREENKDSWYAFMINDKRGKQTVAIVELTDKALEHVKVYYKNKIES